MWCRLSTDISERTEVYYTHISELLAMRRSLETGLKAIMFRLDEGER